MTTRWIEPDHQIIIPGTVLTAKLTGLIPEDQTQPAAVRRKMEEDRTGPVSAPGPSTEEAELAGVQLGLAGQREGYVTPRSSDPLTTARHCRRYQTWMTSHDHDQTTGETGRELP